MSIKYDILEQTQVVKLLWVKSDHMCLIRAPAFGSAELPRTLLAGEAHLLRARDLARIHIHPAHPHRLEVPPHVPRHVLLVFTPSVLKRVISAD